MSKRKWTNSIVVNKFMPQNGYFCKWFRLISKRHMNIHISFNLLENNLFFKISNVDIIDSCFIDTL